MTTTEPTTEEAFWADIGSKPADALPRLVFADWLEERAGFVCWRCKGKKEVAVQWGHHTDDSIDMKCSMCDGTGRGEEPDGLADTAAALRATAAYWPMSDGESWWWYRGNADGRSEQGVLPDDLYDSLSGGGSRWSSRSSNWLFPTALTAVRDLCAAWVKMNKSGKVTPPTKTPGTGVPGVG
jgi:hypothetical protein